MGIADRDVEGFGPGVCAGGSPKRQKDVNAFMTDLPALQARRWDDDEDLAAELLPLLLARLLARSDDEATVSATSKG
jgi:hypothetical protein